MRETLRRQSFINFISGGLTKIGGYSIALTPIYSYSHKCIRDFRWWRANVIVFVYLETTERRAETNQDSSCNSQCFFEWQQHHDARVSFDRMELPQHGAAAQQTQQNQTARVNRSLGRYRSTVRRKEKNDKTAPNQFHAGFQSEFSSGRSRRHRRYDVRFEISCIWHGRAA